MSKSYTPGLKVLHYTLLKKSRILPIKGTVEKTTGEEVKANDIVAKTYLPGNVTMLKLANKLNISPSDIRDVLLIEEGDSIKKGDLIAQTNGLFGFFKSEVISPIDGTIESISDVTGQIVIRDKPLPVQVDAYVRGKVSKIFSDEGVEIETEAALIQGIFGIGGETRGTLKVLSNHRNDEIPYDLINESHAGKIVVGGSFISLETYKKAIDLKIGGIIVGGFNYFDLKEILGYTLGVAITGTEKIGTTLIITEGYGKIMMSERTFDLLKMHDGKSISINGATQIRAGVIRPEIVIPLDNKDSSVILKNVEFNEGIKKGSMVRVIRTPYFGQIGKVVALPSELRIMESETSVRVAEVKIGGEIFIVPRSNLEKLETD